MIKFNHKDNSVVVCAVSNKKSKFWRFDKTNFVCNIDDDFQIVGRTLATSKNIKLFYDILRLEQ